MSGHVSDTEVARWALDASDWLWGTVQGAWNEKQSTSQVIVDAVIGMIPLVGDVTAARDLIAVATRLAKDPAKREDTMEWVLLVVLVFALIPVVGGVIKGVGRLLIKGIREGADNAQVLKDIVEFCNRIGHGNAVAWVRQLDIASYQVQVLDKFNKNNFFIKYTIPEGTTLKAWKGKAAEQFDGEVGQYLPGGGMQLFVDFPAHIKAEVLQLPAWSTAWGKTTKRYGYGPQADAAIGEIELERLAANEVRTKMTGTGP
jgi:hypothetical protein